MKPRGIIVLILTALLVAALITYKNTPQYNKVISYTRRYLAYIPQFFRVFKHNASFVFSPQRRKPLIFAEREAELKAYFRQPFINFDKDDWRWFWGLIFEPIEEKKGNFKVKRYRSKDEIEDELRYEYSIPFKYFQSQHWQFFWEVVFGEK